jgi:hypothetical protein
VIIYSVPVQLQSAILHQQQPHHTLSLLHKALQLCTPTGQLRGTAVFTTVLGPSGNTGISATLLQLLIVLVLLALVLLLLPLPPSLVVSCCVCHGLQHLLQHPP